MRRLIAAAIIFATVPFVAAQDDALYQKHRLRFVEVDGKFFPVPVIPKKIESFDKVSTDVGVVTRLDEVKVDKVRPGEDDMVASPVNPKSGYRYPFMRIKGYPTTNFIDGQVVKKPIDIAIVGTWDAPLTGGASKKIHLAVTVDRAKAGLTKEQFAELVKSGVKLD